MNVKYENALEKIKMGLDNSLPDMVISAIETIIEERIEIKLSKLVYNIGEKLHETTI